MSTGVIANIGAGVGGFSQGFQNGLQQQQQRQMQQMQMEQMQAKTQGQQILGQAIFGGQGAPAGQQSQQPQQPQTIGGAALGGLENFAKSIFGGGAPAGGQAPALGQSSAPQGAQPMQAGAAQTAGAPPTSPVPSRVAAPQGLGNKAFNYQNITAALRSVDAPMSAKMEALQLALPLIKEQDQTANRLQAQQIAIEKMNLKNTIDLRKLDQNDMKIRDAHENMTSLVQARAKAGEIADQKERDRQQQEIDRQIEEQRKIIKDNLAEKDNVIKESISASNTMLTVDPNIKKTLAQQATEALKGRTPGAAPQATPQQGQYPQAPAAEARENNKIYMTQRGPMKWVAGPPSGWAPVDGQ